MLNSLLRRSVILIRGTVKINKYINKLSLFGGSTSTECFLVYPNPGRIGIWKCWFLRRGENRTTNNKLKPHMASPPGLEPGPH